ncbi:protealysin inhibitor emfourin [Nonomuraea sp. NPDC049028]|uniref:protealysin inhibitor emfourin n=1 Tax=Nonomuraea sp. NPDC049028 TaxID=3364348 RepID=UPI00371A26C1
MRVTLETSGGFTGLRRTATLDTDLDEAVDDLLRHLGSGAATEPPGSSQPRYRLTVHRPTGDQVTELTESEVPAALRPLLTELLRHARP